MATKEGVALAVLLCLVVGYGALALVVDGTTKLDFAFAFHAALSLLLVVIGKILLAGHQR